MGRELLTVLNEDVEATERNAAELTDDDLRALYEALVLTREVDRQFAALQAAGEIAFYLPSAPLAAISAGAARAFEEGDWLYPSFRDVGAFLVRGGSIERLVAQLLAGRDDTSLGRQLPGHLSLPSGRFVSVSGTLATQLQHAAGTALSMRLRGDMKVAAAILGVAAAADPGFDAALHTAQQHRVPAVFVVRSRGTERPTLGQRAEGHGIDTIAVDGTDALAVMTAARRGRERAVQGKGATLVEAIIDETPSGEAEPAARLRPFMEHRGIWDAGREEDYIGRCRERIDGAVAATLSGGPPPVETIFDDVYAERPWMLQEQSRQLAGGES